MRYAWEAPVRRRNQRRTSRSIANNAAGQSRAEEIARLLNGAGLAIPTSVEWPDVEAGADGIDDWRSRRVTVVLSP
jgi:hypothetical protein